MANLSSQILSVLLLALMGTISMAGQEHALMLAPAAHPAGCHQHGAKPPASAPVSYRCCQSGHDSALLQASRATQRSSTLLATGNTKPASRTIATQVWAHSLTISSPDPPGTIALRV